MKNNLETKYKREVNSMLIELGRRAAKLQKVEVFTTTTLNLAQEITSLRHRACHLHLALRREGTPVGEDQQEGESMSGPLISNEEKAAMILSDTIKQATFWIVVAMVLAVAVALFGGR